ncbi:unnamed protein product [Lathyrus sativus]|nr:unnamed protein product [Lathyrus sativus]
MPKSKGGLGIKDLVCFNKSLLPKCLWTCINDTSALWKGLLVSKYGNLNKRLMVKREPGNMLMESQWWRDLMRLRDLIEKGSFMRQVSYKIKDGCLLSFWHACWLGKEPLRCAYHDQYNVSVMKWDSVMDIGNWVGKVWIWNLHFGDQDLMGNLLEEFTELLNFLMEVRLHRV